MKIELLKEYIRKNGAIPCVRVSSAQAKGAAKAYAYWGAVRYEARLRKRDGKPTLVALERASSDRRSQRLAEEDAEKIAENENRVYVWDIGEISETAARFILSQLP